MTIYRGVDGANHSIKQQFRGVGGVNREIKEQYRVFNGVNRNVFNRNYADDWVIINSDYGRQGYITLQSASDTTPSIIQVKDGSRTTGAIKYNGSILSNSTITLDFAINRGGNYYMNIYSNGVDLGDLGVSYYTSQVARTTITQKILSETNYYTLSVSKTSPYEGYWAALIIYGIYVNGLKIL